MATEKEILLVDSKDNVIGFETREKAHEAKGILHRAISAFVLNGERQLLIQRRSGIKKLWPLFWSNTCCTHPRINETYQQAAERRIFEELGFKCALKYLYKFEYRADFNNIGAENELCTVLIGKYDGAVRPNADEIAEWKFVDINELRNDMEKNPGKYTPWFKMEFERILKDFRNELF